MPFGSSSVLSFSFSTLIPPITIVSNVPLNCVPEYEFEFLEGKFPTITLLFVSDPWLFTTLPYTSIYRTHSNGIYTTYIGNPFSDRLVNINDENDVLNWAEESLKSLEGSRDAFYERKDIYESNNS